MSNLIGHPTQRDLDIEQVGDSAYDLLVDRTVMHASTVAHDDASDGPNVVRLTLDDGTRVDISAAYGSLITVDRVPD